MTMIDQDMLKRSMYIMKMKLLFKILFIKLTMDPIKSNNFVKLKFVHMISFLPCFKKKKVIKHIFWISTYCVS